MVNCGSLSVQSDYITTQHSYLPTIKLRDEGVKVNSNHINNIKLQSLLLCS
ncbi:hypothetical protein ES703_103462 [subsurface metagenome]